MSTESTKNSETLKTYFESGDKPTEAQFTSLIDSKRQSLRGDSYQVDGRWEIFDPAVILTTPAWITNEGDKGPFFPSMLDARCLGANALADWYIYYSTDHSAGNGGIGLAISNDPGSAAGWTDMGRLFDETLTDLTGTQTETPDVLPIYDQTGVLQRLSMLCHNSNMTNAIGTQSTWEATSSNGVNWTLNSTPTDSLIIDPHYDLDDFRQQGDGHSGYARRIVDSGMEIAFHIDGGTTIQTKGVSGRRYGSLDRFYPIKRYNTTSFNGLIGVSSGALASTLTPFWFRGQLYALAHVQDTPPTSAGAGDQQTDLYMFKVNEKYELYAPQKIIERGDLTNMAYGIRYGDVLNVDDDFVYITFYGYDDASKTNQSIGICKGVLH